MQLQAIVVPLYAGMHLFAVLSKNITDITYVLAMGKLVSKSCSTYVING